ncbi:HAD family hydrolase [Actinoplanes sichuanensis]|uniref:HAD family hydrolase n=1 Tax=Actinoplanes sichuanensis TaxID=512349 RepID=A0ABW4AD25_9ACTN|nr:HAD hydrolase-like protein [Actinoplanes sichuanensis]BEL10056.1 HAD family hydrolase [Actinoplanes sichuanensis]
MSRSGLLGLVGAGPLLLDFDGPVCSVFAGYPAPRVAGELVSLLNGKGVVVPPDMHDPLAVLRWVGEKCSQDLLIEVEDALCAAELHAVGVAAPTPYGHRVILGASDRGLPVAVVSNNSAVAITAYLKAHSLFSSVAVIVGRAYGQPELMKPAPGPVLDAVRALRADPRSCVLVGDSASDIRAAHAAGVASIGYAGKAGKIDALAAADVVVTSMGEIAAALSPESGIPAE